MERRIFQCEPNCLKNIYTLTIEFPKFVQQLDVRIEAKLQQVPKKKNEAHNYKKILNKNFKNSKK